MQWGGEGGGGRLANRIFRTLTFVAPEVDTEYETLVSKLTGITGVFYSATKCDSRTLRISKPTAANK